MRSAVRIDARQAVVPRARCAPSPTGRRTLPQDGCARSDADRGRIGAGANARPESRQRWFWWPSFVVVRARVLRALRLRAVVVAAAPTGSFFVANTAIACTAPPASWRRPT